MSIDFDRLRADLHSDCMGAFFGGGFGGAAMEAAEVETAGPDQLIMMAQDHGFDLSRYED